MPDKLSRDSRDSDGGEAVRPRCRLQSIDSGPNKGSLGCTLPKPEWLQELTMRHQICTGMPTSESGESPPSAALQCLVKVRPGKRYSDLVVFDCEEALLHDFYHRAGDAYTLQIEQVWLLKDGPMQVHWNQVSHGSSISRVAPSRGWAFVPADIREGLEVQRPGSGSIHFIAADVAHPRAHVPMLYVPQVTIVSIVVPKTKTFLCIEKDEIEIRECYLYIFILISVCIEKEEIEQSEKRTSQSLKPEVVAELVAKEAWGSLMALARWSRFDRRGGEEFRCPLEWPSKQELGQLLQQGRAERHSITLDATLLQTWAKQLRQWAPKILSGADGEGDLDFDDERDAVKGMIIHMENLSWEIGRPGAHFASDPAVRLIQTLRLVFDLRDRSNLTRVIKRVIDVLAPSALKSVLLERLQRFGGRSLAFSKSRISRCQLFLDAALMLCRRDEEDVLPMSRVFLVDSSPQVGRDFLCIRGVSVARRSLVDFYSKFKDLVSLELAWQPPDEDEDEEAATNQHRDEARADLVQDLAMLHQGSVLPPVGLGSAASSLVHKISAFTFSLSLEAGTLRGLRKVVEETFAFVVDMGTEIGMSDFMCNGLLTVLPAWLGQSLEPDDGLEADCAADSQGDGEEGREADDLADEGGGGRPENHLFKKCVVIPGILFMCFCCMALCLVFCFAIAVCCCYCSLRLLLCPGMCHILNNADADVDEAMPHWETYYKQLQTLHKLVGDAQRLGRFREQCLVGTVFECNMKFFRTPVKKIAEWRWGSVTSYLTRLVEMGSTLEKAWDAKKHKGVAEDRPGEDDRLGERQREGLDLAQITAVIKDPLFWSFTLMAVAIKQLTKKLLAWAEGCLCHSRCFKEKTIDQQRRHLAREMDMNPNDIELQQLHIFNCCMAGMRAPELAHGEHIVIYHELADLAQAKILSEYCDSLTDAEKAIVIQNFEGARESLALVLTTKLDFWDRLPWATAGLAFHDEASPSQPLQV